MEVSIITNSQARICSAELGYRVNRFCIGSEFISINPRNRIKFYRETTRRNEIKLCCSQRSIRCEAVVSDKAPFLNSTPRTRTVNYSLFFYYQIYFFTFFSLKMKTLFYLQLESVRLFVGLPLDTVSDCNTGKLPMVRLLSHCRDGKKNGS